MEAGLQSAYDQVSYPSISFPQTHPGRLATVAFLRGVRPAPTDRCRVLELGCGACRNLIPMAFHLPNSEFVGLDLAHNPIASGRAFVAELGLRNIALHSIDLCEATEKQFGKFDYIIAHGVYSWVPQPVRERLLGVCREMLNPQGVAYVSYNAYPGNHFRDLVRGMMRFQASCFETPGEKIGQARGLLKFMSESRVNRDYYVDAIKAEFERTMNYPDAGFFHDDLGEVNESFYFHDFIRDAGRHGLQFVGEASPYELNLAKFTPEVEKIMIALGAASEIVREQFKDFLSACGFRQNLLCHKEVELAPDVLLERVPELYAMCDATPAEKPGADGDFVTVFQCAGGDEIESKNPLVGAALRFLCTQCPCFVSFVRLLDVARTASGRKSSAHSEFDDSETLADALIRAYRTSSLRLNLFPPEVTNRVSDRPATSELARLELQRGDCATSPLHISRRFPDALSRQLILLLDGTRDQQLVARDLIEIVQSSGTPVYENGTLVEGPDAIAAVVERHVPEGLRSLARAGMLVR
jgi:SAM-dependent methyltransferase